MKTSIVKFFAGSGIRLAVLSLLFLGLAGVCMAQASAASATADGPAAVAPQAQPVAQPAQTAPTSKRAPKGNHEGITVHGHWIIEVRNPDGKLVSHTEFENSLAPSQGALLLGWLLFGSEVPGGYLVQMGTPTGGPCTVLAGYSGSCLLIGSVISPEPTGFGDGLTGCGAGGTKPISAAGPCFPLSAANNGPSGFTLSGTAVASTSVSITNVYTYVVACPGGGAGSGVAGSDTTSPNACAQTQGIALPLTAATLTTPVTISAVGQLISVNVQISFQ